MFGFYKKIIIIINSLICMFIFSSSFAQEQLIFAVDLIRHGDRTPIHEIPKSPYSWKEGLGELTAEGMRQEFQLGTLFRHKYVEQYGLLPPRYRAETIYVRSTDKNRSLMSAESALLGLYPLGSGPVLNPGKPALPDLFQPIPVHTVSYDQDNLLGIKFETNMETLARCGISQSMFEQKITHFRQKLDTWSRITGMDLHDPKQLNVLAGNLDIRELHHIPLPKGISHQDAQEIIKQRNWIIAALFKCKEITYPMGHEFLMTVAKYLEQASQGVTPLKYVLFSAHDSSIMSVMNTLGAPMNKIPGYASYLNFSLFKKNKEYYVKISLNGKPVIMPTCKSSICSLAKFLELAKN